MTSKIELNKFNWNWNCLIELSLAKYVDLVFHQGYSGNGETVVGGMGGGVGGGLEITGMLLKNWYTMLLS